MNARKNPHAFFSSKKFLDTRARFIAEINAGKDPDWGSLDRIERDIRKALLEEFEHRCAYCQRALGATNAPHLDRFYPKSSYPERGLDWDNMLPSCQECNAAKGVEFPMDPHGAPLLFNPRVDDPALHFEEQNDGTWRGLTPKGETTIDLLQLNRPALVDSRRNERLQETARLRETITTIREIMRKDVGIDGEIDFLGEFAWLLFLKLLDDREIEKETAINRYRSPIPPNFRWQSWASDPEGITGDTLLDFVNNALFPGLNSLPGTDPLSGVIRSVFGNAYNYMKDGTLLREVINSLNEIDLSRPSDRHKIGSIYEQLLSDSLGAGNAGEYYTPRAVTAFIVERVHPMLGETVLDPACGTGGFLACTIDHLRDKYKNNATDEQKIQASIRGIEKKPLPHLLCIINMILHGIDAPTQIEHKNALGRAISDYKKSDLVDVMMTNLPFGGIEEDGIENGFPAAFRTRETADLFLYLLTVLLKDGGRAALVLPDGTLFGEGVKTRVKERLLKECDLHTIVRLPKGVFRPYTSVRTNLLFFTKGKPTREIWYYEHPYPTGMKSYSKTNPMRIEEFEPERSWWNDRKETDRAWRVPIEEIAARNYNLDIPNPRRDRTSTSFRIEWLKLSSFRGVDALKLVLPKQGPTVLIGVNGAGKSTVLDAIAMHLSQFATLMCGESTSHAEMQLDKADIKQGEKQAEVSLLVSVGNDAQVWDLKAPRPRTARPIAKTLQGQIDSLLNNLAQSEEASVPVLCFYPATRGIGDGSRARKRSASRFRQLDAYEGAFGRGLGPFQEFEQWFREEEDAENERRLRIDPAYRIHRLEVVRQAIRTFLTALDSAHYSNLRMERPETGSSGKKSAELVLDKSGVRLSIGQLSEGEKNTLLLVADLASRFAIANPERDEPLQGDGVVLIDEVDLHLHPGWQRELLPALTKTFSGCQFIVSTHSAQVLSRVPKNNVFVLENFKILEHHPHTYGRDANSILGEVMGLPERPKDIEEMIRKAALLVDEERLDEAKQALQELSNTLGDDDNMVVRIRTLAALLEDQD